MIYQKTNWKILILLLLFNQNLLAQLTIDEIIDKHLNTIGLKADKQRVNSFEISGSFVQNKFKLPIKMWGILPNLLRMNMIFNGIDFVKVSNENIDWELNPMKDTLMVKEGKENEATNFYLRWTGGLTEYIKGRISGELLGTSVVEDIEVYKLKIKKGDKYRIYYIDKLSYLLLRVDDDDKEVKKTTYYSDYRNVDGYLFAHRMEGFEFGKLVIIMEFETIKVNAPVDKKLFKVPEKE
ncbi:MAG: outer membrane lipoprotein-sorting protein [Bacteroidota bacterium]